MKTAVTVVIAILANAVGNVFLSKGMQNFQPTHASAPVWLLLAIERLLTNGWLIAGILLLLVFLAAYLAALSWADLSFVLPATAPSYVLTAALAAVFLHESISPARWLGTMLIMAGTGLVASSYVPQTADVWANLGKSEAPVVQVGVPPAEGGAA